MLVLSRVILLRCQRLLWESRHSISTAARLLVLLLGVVSVVDGT
jgi:hypothetical protein